LAAGVGAVVTIHIIAIIAFLKKCSNTIATGRRHAVVGAVVPIDPITIIAGLVADFALLEVVAGDSIATASLSAVVATEIIIILIAVVTVLTFMSDAIAASSPLADIAASVSVVSIAVVAFLDTGSEDAIATLGEAAAIGAAIIVDPIPVIAVFVGRIFWLEVAANDTITTSGGSAAG
tara:strand:+ start:92 stop:625 length:534 start_codon:yes stop_codon:yes gene_type:complete